MKESERTYVPGTRTAPIQYENHATLKKIKRIRQIYQPVRQGNKKYSVSPINCKPKAISVEEENTQQKGPILALKKND